MSRSAWTVETLRQHQKELTKVERRFQKELRKQQAKALKLQHLEYERRLDSLNHAHEQAVQVQHTYVTEEKFNDFVKRYEEYREIVAKALTLAEGKHQTSGEMWTRVVGVFGILGVVAGIIAILH